MNRRQLQGCTLIALTGSMFIGETVYTMKADVPSGMPQAAAVDYALTMPGSAASTVEVIAFGPGSSVSTLH